MKNTVTIKIVVETGIAGGNHEDEFEMDRGEWLSMNEEQREAYLNDAAVEFKNDVVTCHSWVEL